MAMIGCFAAAPAAALDRLRRSPQILEDYLDTGEGEDKPSSLVQIGQAWHGIHYLLTGTAQGGKTPASLAVLGGEEFGPEMGYGRARFLVPSQVTGVASLLSELPVETLLSRFSAKDMEEKGIYPGRWKQNSEEAFEYLMENFQILSVFYRQAARRGDAVVQWLA